MYGATFNTTITIDLDGGREIDVDVDIWVDPGQEQTWDEPGFPDEIDTIELSTPDFPEDDITWNQMNEALDNYLEKYEDKLLEEYYEYCKSFKYY